MEKKNITLVTTDLDGTFLNSQKQVSAINREAIKILKDKGILFGIASGRPIDTIRPMIADWGIEENVSFIVGMNGGVLYDLRRREKEEYHLINGDVVIKIMNFFKDLDVDFQILIGPTRYTNRSTEESKKHSELFGETEVVVDLFDFMKNRDVNKLILYFDPDYMSVVQERASHFFDERVVGFATAENLFEYVDPNVNKGFGMKKLARHYGVSLDTIMAFGDAPNDKEMLGSVGVGVCMKNGSDESKAVATYITDITNDEGAVGAFIEEYFKED